MSDPTRLFDGAGTDHERRIIGLARADAPPQGSLARTLSALGVAGSLLAPAVSHAAALGGAAAGTGAAGAGASGAGITFVTVVKWLGIGVTGGALTVTAAHLAQTNRIPSSRAPALAPSSTSENSIPKTKLEHQTKIVVSTPAEQKPPVGSALGDETRNTLRQELSLLERARRSLAAGGSDEARELLKRHRDEFPSAALAEEAAVLRIEVLLARGESVLAEQAARDFLDAHPTSAHAPRVRNLLVRAASDPKRNARPSMD